MKRFPPILQTLILVIFVLTTARPVFAQDQSKGPVYVVQPGDTLNNIALRFNVDVNSLIEANALLDPNLLSAGMELTIPGLVGVEGKLITNVVPLGESLSTLSRRYQIPAAMLVKLNKITSPAEIYAGTNLILPQSDEQPLLQGQTIQANGQSLLETAVLNNLNPWALVAANHRSGTWDTISGDTLFFASETAKTQSSIPQISQVTIAELPLVQGKTAVIKVTSPKPLKLSGTLINRDLRFFAVEGTAYEYVALQGVHAMTRPGLVAFRLNGVDDSGQDFQFEQMVLVQAGGYVQDPPLYVATETIDPAFTKPEDDQIQELVTPVSEPKLWSEIFSVPVDEPVCIQSWYGNRRSYNGSDFTYFHTGVDYGVCANLNLYAPAPGVVVFAGPMTVRGNATIIDHGWGVYSGIYHQSEIQVKVGDRVEAGQLVGLVGGTGRVTGPHLHWEVWVNGVQVEPLDWLERVYP